MLLIPFAHIIEGPTTIENSTDLMQRNFILIIIIMRAISNKLYKMDNSLLRLMVYKIILSLTNLDVGNHSTLPP